MKKFLGFLIALSIVNLALAATSDNRFFLYVTNNSPYPASLSLGKGNINAVDLLTTTVPANTVEPMKVAAIHVDGSTHVYSEILTTFAEESPMSYRNTNLTTIDLVYDVQGNQTTLVSDNSGTSMYAWFSKAGDPVYYGTWLYKTSLAGDGDTLDISQAAGRLKKK